MTNAKNWKVTGSNSDDTIELTYFEGTEAECRHYCESAGFSYNAWICQRKLEICEPREKTLLETVIDNLIGLNDGLIVDRRTALEYIAKQTDKDLFGFAKLHKVLVQDSAADFACEFYSAFNDEVYYRY
jgi:hypothetical protein